MPRNDLSKLSKNLTRALQCFLESDAKLLNLGVNERSVSSKLAAHLSQVYADYDVDCEYNRNANQIKRLRPEQCLSNDIKGTTIFPDIIIHKRGNNSRNELVIEVKKINNNDDMRDIEKLKCLTDLNGYGYNYGLQLKFGKQKVSDITVWIQGSADDDATEYLKKELKAADILITDEA